MKTRPDIIPHRGNRPRPRARAAALAIVLAAGVTAVLARVMFSVELDNVVLMFGAAVVILVGSALYEAIWNRSTIQAPVTGLTREVNPA